MYTYCTVLNLPSTFTKAYGPNRLKQSYRVRLRVLPFLLPHFVKENGGGSEKLRFVIPKQKKIGPSIIRQGFNLLGFPKLAKFNPLMSKNKFLAQFNMNP